MLYALAKVMAFVIVHLEITDYNLISELGEEMKGKC